MKNAIEIKVKESFKSEFLTEVKKIEIYNNYAELLSENNIWFYCKINSKGVKKNSWRTSH
jgi:hypothetical protein